MFGNKPAFGSSNTNTFSSPSSGTSLFGQKPAGSSLFGSNTGTTQSTSLWGSNKPASNSLFGSQPQQQNSLFGSSNTNTSSSSLFGSGQNKSIFGTQQNANSSFGSTSGGIFGSSNTSNTGGSLFGSSTAGAGTSGTTVKFEPVIGSDTMMRNNITQNISTKHMCITSMKQYDSKSIEELRVEDYIANRKAPTAGSTGGSLFGSNTTANTSGGLFGSSNQSTSLFGNKDSNVFGQSANSGSIFSSNQQQQQQQNSLFASKPAGGSLFGSSQSTTGGSLFGSNTQQQSGSIFGSSTSAPFGSTATTQSGFLFGSGTQATTSTFGQPAAGGSIFGTNTSQANTSGGLFAKPAGTGAFSFATNTANTGFGTTTSTSGGLFSNQTQNKPLFGSTTGGGLFGNTQQTGGGLFGQQSQQQQAGGLFGNTQATTTTIAAPAQVAVAAAAPIVLGSDVNQRAVERALFEAQIAASPYGDGPLLKWTMQEEADVAKQAQTDGASVERHLKFIGAIANSPLLSAKDLLSPILPKPGSTPSSVKSSPIVVKDLSYKTTSRVPTLASGIRHIPAMNNSPLSKKNVSFDTSIRDRNDDLIEKALLAGTNSVKSSTPRRSIKHLDNSFMRNDTSFNTSQSMRVDQDELPQRERPAQRAAANTETGQPANRKQIPVLVLEDTVLSDKSSPEKAVQAPQSAGTQNETSPAHRPRATSPLRQPESQRAPELISVLNDEYTCVPSITAMRTNARNGEIDLPDGIRISRVTYGSVYWPGPFKLKGELKIDEVVVFRHKEVTVYPDESLKPPVGEGLNRAAEITLERVWPTDKETKEVIKDATRLVEMRWRERLEKVSARIGASFVDYRPSTGSWVFKVEHFSTYGLPEDDISEEDTSDAPAHKKMRR